MGNIPRIGSDVELQTSCQHSDDAKSSTDDKWTHWLVSLPSSLELFSVRHPSLRLEVIGRIEILSASMKRVGRCRNDGPLSEIFPIDDDSACLD